MNEDNKVYRVYKLWSVNTDKFYIDYTRSESYLSMVLQGMISRYKKSNGDLSKYKKYFYILSQDGLKIEELGKFDNIDNVREYLKKLYDDENCINVRDVEYDYVFKVILNAIRIKLIRRNI
jgi:hypothetical protein